MHVGQKHPGQRGISFPISLINYSTQPLLTLLRVPSYGSTDIVQRIMGLFSLEE